MPKCQRCQKGQKMTPAPRPLVTGATGAKTSRPRACPCWPVASVARKCDGERVHPGRNPEADHGGGAGAGPGLRSFHRRTGSGHTQRTVRSGRSSPDPPQRPIAGADAPPVLDLDQDGPSRARREHSASTPLDFSAHGVVTPGIDVGPRTRHPLPPHSPRVGPKLL